MRSRRQIASMFVLVLAALVLAVFALQSSGPERRSSRHGNEDLAQNEGEQDPRVSQIAPAATAPELPPLKEFPPKPAIRNDPASNKVWFRLLDAETIRPIANTPAIFASFGIYEDERVWWHASNSFGDDKTDANGLFAGTFRDFDKWPRQQYDPQKEPDPNARANLAYEDGKLERCVYPLAKGYEPGTPAAELEPVLLAFAEGKYADVIDVSLRRMRTLSGKVLDSTGQPVSGAGVFAIPERGDGNDSWLSEWSYYYMDIPPNDEAWPRPGTRTAKIMREQFERERPVINAESGASVIPRSEINRPDRFRFTTMSKWGEFWTSISDAQGRFVIPEMPRGEWISGAWHPAHGFITQPVRLIEANDEITIVLPNDNTARIELTVEWVGPTSIDALGIGVDSAGPYGLGHNGGVSADFNALTPGLGPWRFTVTGLREGLWQISAGFTRIAVALRAGAIERMTIRCGPGILGKWRPYVRLGDVVLEQPQVHVESVNALFVFECGDVPSFTAPDENGWYDLPQGEYEASIAGSPPVRFKIVSGATLESRFNLALDSFEFSISEELAALLGGEVDEITLSLEPSENALPFRGDQPPGLLQVNNAALEAMNAAAKEDAPWYADLAPGRRSTWRIPHGVYEWSLKGRRDSLEGTVDLRQLSRVEFSLSNLPGLAVLTWDLAEGQSRDNSDANYLKNCRASLAYLTDLEPNEYGSLTADYRQQYLWSPDARSMHLIAPPGHHALEFTYESRKVTRVVSFPGTIRLAPQEFEPRDPRVVSLIRDSENNSYLAVLALADDGRFEWAKLDRSEDPKLFLTDGTWTLYIERRGTWLHDDESRHEFGVLRLLIAGSDTTANLAGADYQSYGKLSVELAGKSPAESERDPWWRKLPCVSVQSLDICTSGIFATALIFGQSFILGGPSLKPSLKSWAQACPPGRYKIIPWLGAPESACKIVTVEPGKECVVRFEGR